VTGTPRELRVELGGCVGSGKCGIWWCVETKKCGILSAAAAAAVTLSIYMPIHFLQYQAPTFLIPVDSNKL